ncbi:hypothetical protein VAR608DRAFT_1325 [Variovorax sp. HW608]|nr:hypothetical protein VAR608DRAFT_1325 [Variovorax sp. HW608]
MPLRWSSHSRNGGAPRARAHEPGHAHPHDLAALGVVTGGRDPRGLRLRGWRVRSSSSQDFASDGAVCRSRPELHVRPRARPLVRLQAQQTSSCIARRGAPGCFVATSCTGGLHPALGEKVMAAVEDSVPTGYLEADAKGLSGERGHHRRSSPPMMRRRPHPLNRKSQHCYYSPGEARMRLKQGPGCKRRPRDCHAASGPTKRLTNDAHLELLQQEGRLRHRRG